MVTETYLLDPRNYFMIKTRRVTFAIAAAAAVASLTVGNASADVVALSVSGDTHVTGTAYTLTADTGALTFGDDVRFFDNGVEIAGSPANPDYISQFVGQAVLQWTPKTVGSHVIVAKQDRVPGKDKTITIEVAKGVDTGNPSTGSFGS